MPYDECYACMVGVWTGPESHSPGCSAATAGEQPERVVHRVFIDYDTVRSSWECSCGRSGSADSDRVDVASDKHIDYDAGERRVDTSSPF